MLSGAQAWLLAHALPHREFAAASILKDRFDFDVYLPVVRVPTPKYSIYKGQPYIKRPLLYRYMFVREGSGNRDLGPLSVLRARTHGSIGCTFLRHRDGLPIIVGDDVINKIKLREDSEGFIQLDDPKPRTQAFRKGERVRVMDAAGFDMWDALFQKMHGAHRAELFVGCLGSLEADIRGRAIVLVSRIRRFD